MTAIAPPRTATAASRPCELVGYHAPAVVRTQGHHRRPQYLQVRLWGEVRDETLLWLCGSCHDAVHEWIGFLLGESRRPAPEPGRLAKAEAQRTVDWYRAQGGR
jgi:hypothetical protein